MEETGQVRVALLQAIDIVLNSHSAVLCHLRLIKLSYILVGQHAKLRALIKAGSSERADGGAALVQSYLSWKEWTCDQRGCVLNSTDFVELNPLILLCGTTLVLLL